LRDYGIEGQIGLEASPEEHIQKLATYFHEVKRVLSRTGSLYINLGDTYSRKNLQMIPARVVLALQEDGWIVRNDIIWYKPNHMPSSFKDRLSSTYEHLFHLVKSKKYFYDLDSIRVPHKTGPAKFNYRVREAKKGHFGIISVKAASEEIERHDNKGQRVDCLGDVFYYTKFNERCQAKRLSQGLAYARKILGREHETAINHPLGKNPGDVIQLKFKKQHSIRQDPNLGGGVGLAEFREWCRANNLPECHFMGKNPGDFWEINTKPFPEAHFAVYPEALCIRPILSSCPPGGIVFDPFAGSGTTMKVALDLGRNSIGIELNCAYVEIIRKRVPSLEENDIIQVNKSI
jgi:DNA modification methylase